MERSYLEDGDLIRGIDLLGNAGFVRNVVEKAQDHRVSIWTMRISTLLASDLTDSARITLRRIRAKRPARPGRRGCALCREEDEVGTLFVGHWLL